MHVWRTLDVLEEFLLLLHVGGEKERRSILASASNLIHELHRHSSFACGSCPLIAEWLQDLLYHCRHLAGFANDGWERKEHLTRAREALFRLRSPEGFGTETG